MDNHPTVKKGSLLYGSDAEPLRASGVGAHRGLRLPAGTDPDPTRNRSGDLPEPHRTGYIDAESAAKARGAASLDPGQQALACAEPYWRTALAAPLSGALHCAITQEPRG